MNLECQNTTTGIYEAILVQLLPSWLEVPVDV